MQAIMISIKPKWVAKILNGEKTIEIRKIMPKCDLPIDVYIYCSKNGEVKNDFLCLDFINYLVDKTMRGKVVAKFTLNNCIPCRLLKDNKFNDFFYKEYQLTRRELKDYVGDKVFYEWYIDNIGILDEPKELNEFSVRYPKGDIKFKGIKGKMLAMKPLTKAPQSWCYVEIEE